MEHAALLYLQLAAQPEHFKNANDWQLRNILNAHCAARLDE